MNFDQSLIGLPGSHDILKQSLRGSRDTLNVDDIEGAVPRRLVGYTGARPDVLLQKEQAQFNIRQDNIQKLNVQSSLTNTNQMLPAGYRNLQQPSDFLSSPQKNEHFKNYEQRHMRTDDIDGAQPKGYGNNGPINSYAGNSALNNKTYKNDSDLFQGETEQNQQTLQSMLNKNYNTASSPNINNTHKNISSISKPFNPQFQTSYAANYSPNGNALKALQLAKPFKPDMDMMFRGHNDIAGGLSGASGVGNLGTTFQTNYQKNFNYTNDYQKLIEKEQSKRIQENFDKVERERLERMVREKSPQQQDGQNEYKNNYGSLYGEENIPKHIADRAILQELEQRKLEDQSRQAMDRYKGIDLNFLPNEQPQLLKIVRFKQDNNDDLERLYSSTLSTTNAGLKHDPSKQTLLRSSLQQNAENMIHGERTLAGVTSQTQLQTLKDRNTYVKSENVSDINGGSRLGNDYHHSLENTYKHLSMAPTTDQGRNHEVIDHNIKNRESMKYGNQQSPVVYDQLMPKLNDRNYHRASQRARSNFNVLTGTYKKPESDY